MFNAYRIFFLQVHHCAGKLEGEPREHYIWSAQDIMINNCAKYEQAGNKLRGRNLTMDRAYTGYDAVTRCGTEFQMTCLGTVQASRKGLPKEFTSTEGRPVGDLKVLYDVNSKISIHSKIQYLYQILYYSIYVRFLCQIHNKNFA